LRILQAGDLHLDINGKRLGRLILTNGGINEVYTNRLKILQHIINKGIEEKCDYFALPGDIFNRNRPYPQEYLDLHNILKPVKDKVLLLFGNHDNYTVKGCGLQPLEAIGYKVALELTTFDKFIYLAPWGTPIEAIAEATKGQGILLLHGGVKDHNTHWVQVEGEEGNYHLADLQALNLTGILLQHHHNQRELAPGIWYAGSPEVFTFGEENDKKGFLIWEVDNKLNKVTPYSTKGLYPEYKTFTPNEFLNYSDVGIDAYIRIKGIVSEQERIDITKKLSDFKCFDYSLDLHGERKLKNEIEIKGISQEEQLRSFLSLKKYGNIEELVKLDKEISEDDN
jgi:DNA repair exonuclease SbcCD nuclease subunit